MKNSNNKNLDNVLDFFIRADTSAKSVDFWEKKLADVIEQLDELDASLCEKDSNKEEFLINELKTIMNRAKIELAAIDNLENEIETYLKEKKVSQTKAKKIKP